MGAISFDDRLQIKPFHCAARKAKLQRYLHLFLEDRQHLLFGLMAECVDRERSDTLLLAG